VQAVTPHKEHNSLQPAAAILLGTISSNEQVEVQRKPAWMCTPSYDVLICQQNSQQAVPKVAQNPVHALQTAGHLINSRLHNMPVIGFNAQNRTPTFIRARAFGAGYPWPCWLALVHERCRQRQQNVLLVAVNSCIQHQDL
jgi:hypothetical protein